jgi:hypothetical protein
VSGWHLIGTFCLSKTTTSRLNTAVGTTWVFLPDDRGNTFVWNAGTQPKYCRRSNNNPVDYQYCKVRSNLHIAKFPVSGLYSPVRSSLLSGFTAFSRLLTLLQLYALEQHKALEACSYFGPQHIWMLSFLSPSWCWLTVMRTVIRE